MRIFIIAILATSLLALSPSTQVPQHYDDMLFNNLGPKMKTLEATATQHTSYPYILPIAMGQVMRHCAEHMNTEDFNSAKTIIRQVVNSAKAGQDETSFHGFFAAFDYRNEVARTYELTLIRKTNTISAVLSSKNHAIDHKEKYSFYYETYESEFGLPFQNVQVGPIFDNEVNQEIIAYLRNYLLRSAQRVRGSQIIEKGTLGGIADWITKATGAVGQITGAAQNLISTFKNTKTEAIKEMIKGDGFKNYSTKSRFLRSLGVPSAKYDRFIRAYKVLTGLGKSKYQEEVEAFTDIAEFVDENTWMAQDFMFTEGAGKMNSVITLTKADMMEQVTHFVTVNMQGTFELAPDVMVITKHKSIVGGLFENTKDVRKNIPRTISNDEIKAIQSLMLLSSINVMSDAFGVPFKLPNDDPNKL